MKTFIYVELGGVGLSDGWEGNWIQFKEDLLDDELYGMCEEMGVSFDLGGVDS